MSGSPRLATRKPSIDLDGDGRHERVAIEPTKPGAFLLRVGKAQIEGELPGVQGFTLVDVDSGDKRKEVLVHGEEQGLPRRRLFRWVDGALQELPLPPGTPSASGNGILLSDVPMSGWARRDKYLYDGKKPGFTGVPQGLYAVGHAVPAPGLRHLQRSPQSPEVAHSSSSYGNALDRVGSLSPEVPSRGFDCRRLHAEQTFRC